MRNLPNKYNLRDYKKVMDLWEINPNKTEIAKKTGIPRTTISDWVLKKHAPALANKSIKVLSFDIETSLCKGVFWRPGKQVISPDQLTQDRFMHCCALKWQHQKQARVVSQIDDMGTFKKDHTNDYIVTKTMRDAFEKADIIVAHNGDRFDWMAFMARLAINRLPPVRKPRMIDTLKLARKFGFTSKRLKDLAITFKVDLKAKSEYAWWLGAVDGDIECHKKLKKYCARDIPPMDALLKIIAPYVPELLPNYNLFAQTDGDCCPCCGSRDIRRDGEFVRGKVSLVAALICNDCGANFDDGKKLNKGIVFRA